MLCIVHRSPGSGSSSLTHLIQLTSTTISSSNPLACHSPSWLTSIRPWSQLYLISVLRDRSASWFFLAQPTASRVLGIVSSRLQTTPRSLLILLHQPRCAPSRPRWNLAAPHPSRLRRSRGRTHPAPRALQLTPPTGTPRRRGQRSASTAELRPVANLPTWRPRGRWPGPWQQTTSSSVSPPCCPLANSCQLPPHDCVTRFGGPSHLPAWPSHRSTFPRPDFAGHKHMHMPAHTRAHAHVHICRRYTKA